MSRVSELVPGARSARPAAIAAVAGLLALTAIGRAKAEAPASDPRLSERQIVRIAYDHLDRAPQEHLDPCSFDPAGAVLYLTEPEISRLEVPFERLGSLADHLRRFRPAKTLATVGIPSVASVLREPSAPTTSGRVAAGTVHLDYDRYHSPQEGIDFFHNLAEAHPGIVRLSSIGQSLEGRDLWTLKITDNPDLIEPDEERIFFCALHHAREWATHEVILSLAEHLLTRYDTDLRIRHIIDNSVVWILLAANPDGFEYSWTTDRMWRKNRRRSGGTIHGVDLNRNYDYNWGFDEYGSSGSRSAETYRGSFPASEPETQAIQDLLTAETPAIAVTYHTYSQLVLYPWGYTKDVNPEAYTSLRGIGDRYAAIVKQVHDMDYTPGMGSYTIYRTNGDFTDYAYGAHGILAYTPELRPISSNLGGFLLPEQQIQPNNEENLAAAIWLMDNVASAALVPSPPGVFFSPGYNPFSLPLTPVNQKPEASLGMDAPAVDYLAAWLDDVAHVPAYYGAYPADFEGIGAGSGYRFHHTPESQTWAEAFAGYKALPYVFEDGAVVMIENYKSGVNYIGIPSETPIRMRDIRIYRRGIYSRGTTFGREERILETRTALEDLHHDMPWISWEWTHTSADGTVYASHPEGLNGMDEYVHPHLSYAFPVYRRSYSYGGSGMQVLLLQFPPSLCGDADNDADIDLADHAEFRECMTGPVQQVLEDPCPQFDVDHDFDVDARDFAAVQRQFGRGQ